MTAAALRILSRGQWPEGDDGPLPPLPGFTASSFNPLVAEAAERCLRAHHGTPPTPGPGPGSTTPPRTALLLASRSGDRSTALAIDTAAASDRRMPPLLFFQSNPNAVLGHVAARWQLTGPVVVVRPAESVPGEVPADAVDLAELLLADGDADRVLVIAAEQEPGADRAVALLISAR